MGPSEERFGKRPKYSRHSFWHPFLSWQWNALSWFPFSDNFFSRIRRKFSLWGNLSFPKTPDEYVLPPSHLPAISTAPNLIWKLKLGSRTRWPIKAGGGNLIIVKILFRWTFDETVNCEKREKQLCRAINRLTAPISTNWLNTIIVKKFLLEHSCIRTLPRGGMYWVVHPRRPRDFPREISRSEGLYNPMHPDSRQCTAILSSLIHP